MSGENYCRKAVVLLLFPKETVNKGEYGEYRMKNTTLCYIEKDGKDIMIGFNPKFLIDALKVIDDEKISIYLVNPKAPCFIKDEKESYIYLILPVNFNAAR